MIQPLMKNPMFLSVHSSPATADDLPVARDLTDTLLAHADHCVGMAANMIGVHKRIIVVATGLAPMVMINPVITKKSGPYTAEEGCLSLMGVRQTTRYKSIEVDFLGMDMKPRHQAFTDFLAQIIQHEVDHCDGILI